MWEDRSDCFLPFFPSLSTGNAASQAVVLVLVIAMLKTRDRTCCFTGSFGGKTLL